MDFPAEGVIGERGYAIKEKEHEGYSIGVGLENSKIKTSIQIIYDSYKIGEYVQSNTDRLEKGVGKALEFKKINKSAGTLYISPIQYEDVVYGYAAYFQNVEGSGGIEVISISTCEVSKQECEELKEKETQKLYDWILSIEFLNK